MGRSTIDADKILTGGRRGYRRRDGWPHRRLLPSAGGGGRDPLRECTLPGRPRGDPGFDGFLFNRGGHALYTGGAASRVFEELGITYGHGIPKDTCVLQGGKLSPFPADPLGLLRTDVLDAGDKLALVRLFVALGAAKPRALAKTSIQELFDLKIRRPQLRRLMMALARTFVYSYGAGPRQRGTVRRQVPALAEVSCSLRRRRMAHAGGRVARCGGAGRGAYR